jgi:hypothetical protein
MVGEMRDLETAEIAIRAALTGHLVFSTLHTNDAVGGITRLLDMGVEPFLVSASVRAFLAQRLVRRLCKNCRKRPQEAAFGGRRRDGVGRGVWKSRVRNIGSRPEGRKAVTRHRTPRGSPLEAGCLWSAAAGGRFWGAPSRRRGAGGVEKPRQKHRVATRGQKSGDASPHSKGQPS